MNTLFFKRIVCMLIIIIMLTPINNILADDQNDKTQGDITINILQYTPIEIKENDTLTVQLQVATTGESIEEPITIHLCLNQRDMVIDTKNINGLTRAEPLNITMNWITQQGNHTLIAIADPNNNITKENEINKQDQITIYVKGTNTNAGNSNDADDSTTETGEITHTTYGDNIKYEHLSNGMTRATLPFPTVYDEQQDEWQPVDLTIIWNDDLGVWGARKARYDISFSEHSSSKELFNMKMNDEWIVYSLFEGKKSTYDITTNELQDISERINVSSTVENNEISYENVFNETDITYSLLPFGLKETIVLHSAPNLKKMDGESYVVYEGELTFSKNLTLWVDGEQIVEKTFRTEKKNRV